MSDPTSPPTPPRTPDIAEDLLPRLLAKLKVEIEGYELIERIGEGGQASVYKAIQKRDGKVVAVKVLHAGPHATEEARLRLKRETNALRAINHPNIVQAIAAGRTRSGLECLVMTFIDGRSLDALWTDLDFAAKVAPNPADRLRLFKVICETVQAAHRRGITHRDLSPSNILIDNRGQPHVLDFGMASTAFDGVVSRDITVTGQFIGKLKYASPEQARGARTNSAVGRPGDGHTDIDIRADVYALGVMLYQLLTNGAFPYEVVGNVIDVLHNIIHSKPRRPSDSVVTGANPVVEPIDSLSKRHRRQPAVGALSSNHVQPERAAVRRDPPLVNESIEAIVLKALEKDPDHRYQSAGELASDIDRYLAGQPTSAVVWSKRSVPSGFVLARRRPSTIAAFVILSVTLTGAVMTVKPIATWLGFAVAVAPVLPAEITPVIPGAAVAAIPAASQPDGSDRRLNDLAADLALIDARLRAVHKQLAAATSRKPPELDDRQDTSSGPLPAAEFLKGLATSANETGRLLNFDVLPEGDRDRAEEAEAAVIERETDQAVLLARRTVLDAEQAKAWTRLSWGTFTGREVDRLFRFRLKNDPSADAVILAKRRVIEAGVRLRRVTAKAMDDAAQTLRTPSGTEGATDSIGPDFSTVTSTVASQVRTELVSFHKTISLARDSGGLVDSELAGIMELQKQADRLRDALDGSGEMFTKAIDAKDELERFVARGRLQRDLRDIADASSQLDAQLVALAAAWKIDVNAAVPLPDVALPVAQRPVPMVTEQPQAQPAVAGDATVADLFPVGSVWEGRYVNEGNAVNGRNATARVIRHDGKTVVLEVQVSGYALRQRYIDVDGNKLTQWKDEAVSAIQESGAPPNRFSAINIKGEINDGTLTLSGTHDVHSNNGRFLLNERGTLTLKQKGFRRANGPSHELSVGDGFQGTLTDNDGVHNTSAVVDTIRGNTVVLKLNPDFGPYGMTIVLDGEKVSAVSYVSFQPNPSRFRIISSTGTIQKGRLLVTIKGVRIPQKGPQTSGTWTLDLTSLKALEPAR